MKKRSLLFLIIIALVFSLVACKNPPQEKSGLDEYGYVEKYSGEKGEFVQNLDQNVKNIILLIGDGMGKNHIEVTKMITKRSLDLDALEYKGEIETSCLDNYVTDSAASATAYATGVKTVYERAGKDENGNDLKTILDYAHEAGKKTGVVTDKALSDATPLAFTAHLNNRYKEPLTIAPQQIKSNVDVMLGSGVGKFKSNKALMKEYGYDFVENKEDLMNLESDKYIGAFSDSNKLYEAQIYPTLPEMAKKAIDTLSKCEEGFFLMIESGQIDNYCGDGNIKKMAEKVVALDQVLRICVNFAYQNPETLIIVLADHETGGLVIKDGEPDKNWFTSVDRYHTDANVPLYAFGMNSSIFDSYKKDVFINTEIFEIMFKAFGFEK